jgi:hypothetical protein
LVCVRALVELPGAVERRELERVERRVVALELRDVFAFVRREPAEVERREPAEVDRRFVVPLVVGLLPAFELLLVAMWCLTPFP